MNVLLNDRNIQLYLELAEGKNLGFASYKSFITIYSAIRISKLFVNNGLISLKKIENKRMYFDVTDKGKQLYDLIINIKRINGGIDYFESNNESDKFGIEQL